MLVHLLHSRLSELEGTLVIIQGATTFYKWGNWNPEELSDVTKMRKWVAEGDWSLAKASLRGDAPQP